MNAKQYLEGWEYLVFPLGYIAHAYPNLARLIHVVAAFDALTVSHQLEARKYSYFPLLLPPKVQKHHCEHF
jgi:hypothetical protein